MIIFLRKLLKKDKGLGKLVENVSQGEDRGLMEIGFDSLDVMMLTYMLQDEYKVEPQISKEINFNEVIERLNTLLLKN